MDASKNEKQNTPDERTGSNDKSPLQEVLGPPAILISNRDLLAKKNVIDEMVIRLNKI